MSYKDGGTAFPTEKTGQLYGSDGMSLRDYLASKAFPVMYEQAVQLIKGKPLEDGFDLFRVAADASYEAADAMLEARNVR